MMQEWTPPECIDYALSEKFLKDGNWTWYADASAQIVATADEVFAGADDFNAAFPEYNLSILLLALSQGFALLSLGFSECEISPVLNQEKAWLSQALPACKNGLNCS